MGLESLYQEPHQARTREPTAWENEFADVIEAAFAAGAHDLDAVVRHLNASRVRTPEGAAWTEARFVAIVAALGD